MINCCAVAEVTAPVVQAVPCSRFATEQSNTERNERKRPSGSGNHQYHGLSLGSKVKILIQKLVMLTLRAHYEPLNSN